MGNEDTGEDLVDLVVARLIAELNDPSVYVFAAGRAEEAKFQANNLLALAVVYTNTEWGGIARSWPIVKSEGQVWFGVIAYARDASAPGAARKAAATLLGKARRILVPAKGWCPAVFTRNNPVALRNERPDVEEGDRATRILECTVAVRYES